MRISDWSSDVCSSDLRYQRLRLDARQRLVVKARRRQRQFQQLEGPRTVVSQGGQVDGDVIAVSVEADRDRLVAHGILEIVGFQVAGALGEQSHRSEEHTSELQSLMRSSSAVFCLKK